MGISQRSGISILDSGIPAGGTTNQILKKASNTDYDVEWGSGGGGGSSAFDDITSGTNTTATMVVGSGASLAPSGTGTVTANVLSGTAATQQSSVFIETGADKTITLLPYALYAATINKIWDIKTTSGTITVAIQINGTPVTGLSAISVTSTPQNVTATAANTIAVGDEVTMVLSSNSSATKLQFTMESTR